MRSDRFRISHFIFCNPKFFYLEKHSISDHKPQTASNRPVRGFTMAELLVSISILIIITLAVAGDVSKSRKREELVSSARLVHNAIRDAQARAQTARSVKMCDNAGINVVCEARQDNCGIGN